MRTDVQPLLDLKSKKVLHRIRVALQVILEKIHESMTTRVAGAWIFGHKPERQKKGRASSIAVVVGRIAPGL
jgi:hypothetical protein